MNKDVAGSFEFHFGELKDRRIERHKLYPLTEILFVVLCGTICGAEGWRDYVLFGKEKLNFLRQHFPFKNGIPSKNTLSRVFYVLALKGNQGTLNDDVRLFLEAEFQKRSSTAIEDRYENDARSRSELKKKQNGSRKPDVVLP